MKIDYTYKIISADKTARCMEIVYTANGHQTLHISARLPFEGEDVEKIVQMYAPIRFWIDQKTPVVMPEIGMTGAFSFDDTPVIQTANTTGEQPVVQGAQTL